MGELEEGTGVPVVHWVVHLAVGFVYVAGQVQVLVRIQAAYELRRLDILITLIHHLLRLHNLLEYRLSDGLFDRLLGGARPDGVRLCDERWHM